MFKVQPFEHQRECLNLSWKREYWALFLETGTGKSKILVDNIALLWRERMIDAVLIFSRKGAYGQWQVEHFPDHWPDYLDYDIFTWSGTNRNREQTKQFTKVLASHPARLRVMAMNIEALAHEGAQEWAKAFVRDRRVLIAIDESTVIKNDGARRTKAALELGGMATYRRILSGYPVTKSPMDLYSQCAFLSEKALGFPSYYAFQGRYSIMEKVTFGSQRDEHGKLIARSIRRVKEHRRIDELTEKLKTFSYRKLKRDCLNLPEKIFEYRNVELTTEQREHYEKMKREAYILFFEKEVSASMRISQIQKLQQILCGFMISDTGETIPIPNNRLSTLLDETENVDKAIIICAFTYDVETIYAALCKKYGADRVRHYYGKTAQRDRPQIVLDYKDGKVDWLVGHPATVGYGLTLTAASTTYYYSNSFNLEHRLQSEDRTDRISQIEHPTYIDLRVLGTVDEHIIENLRGKLDIATQVMGDGWRKWLE